MRKGISVGLLLGMLLFSFFMGYMSEHRASHLTQEENPADKAEDGLEPKQDVLNEENMSALLRDECQEIVIEEGLVYEDAVVYECGGQGRFSSGDAALDGEEIGRMVLDVLDGRDAEQYREAFEGENFFEKFRNQDWEQLEAEWKANGYYDCYYTYVTEPQGYVGYTCYIYPDFDRTVFVKDGEIIEGGGWIIIPSQNTVDNNKSLYTYEDMGSEQLVDLLRRDLEKGDLENGGTSRHRTGKVKW